MPRRLAWAVLPALAIIAAPPAAAATITAGYVMSDGAGAQPVAASSDRLGDWHDAAGARVPGATAADADLASLTIAIAVQRGAGTDRGKAGAPIASRATATAKTIARLPEPATWVMLILGFGGVGAAVRRQLRRSDERFNEHIRRIVASADETA